jgi:hypothetical protein
MTAILQAESRIYFSGGEASRKIVDKPELKYAQVVGLLVWKV